jgi:hypothetical protein
MTEQKVPEGQSGEPVAAPENQEAAKSTIAYETHRKLLDEKKKLQAQLESFLSKEKEREEADARKRGDYEALLKAREEELVRERKERQELSDRITHGLKMNSVLEALGGNVDQKWFKLIDTTEVAINPETGEIDQMTVARVAESLKRQWPEMIQRTAKFPAAAPQGVNGGPGKITESEWRTLKSTAEMQKWKRDQIVWGQ